MDKTQQLRQATQRNFGYQWTHFADMVGANREHFFTYIYPIDDTFFEGKFGLDAACGFGRHLYYAHECGARMVGVDFSDAIFAAKGILKGKDGASLVKGDLYRLPFRHESFDFIYCLGALHHLSDPEGGFQSLLPYLKRGGAVFVWVYSKRRWLLNAILEAVRAVTTKLPPGLLRYIALLFAAADYGLFTAPYRFLKSLLGQVRLRPWAPPRIRLYAKFPFRVCHADWFDRLGAPIRFYYDEQDLAEWASRAGLKDVQTSETGAYGCRLLAYKPS
ncbi:MAG: class I SAM-dependent methyltransferase [Nitrospira sp.]|nr:class I SAM-dependent methyltransferase [Nitrospira sp.]